MKIWHVLLVAAIALAAPAAAQERVTLGWGRIFDNELLPNSWTDCRRI